MAKTVSQIIHAGSSFGYSDDGQGVIPKPH
jgi:hypothetical protein